MKTKSENLLPSLQNLMTGPVIIKPLDPTYIRHRQLRAAKLSGNIYLRLRLITLDEAGDADEWEEHRKTLGSGVVMCPECEVNETEPSECDLCEGDGMVTREEWDKWYFTNKSCRDYKDGCEKTCRFSRCSYDLARSAQSVLVLALDAASAGGTAKWQTRGNSLDGFRLEGLCGNVAALARYINLVADSVGAMSMDDIDEEEED